MQLNSKEVDHQEYIDRMSRLHEETLEKTTAKLSKSLRNREVEYSQLESMHLAVKSELEQRTNELEVKLAKTKDKLKQAENRRALEAEGFTNDVSILRKQLNTVDRKLHQMRLQNRLQDDERLHSMLQKLENKGPKCSDQVGFYVMYDEIFVLTAHVKMAPTHVMITRHLVHMQKHGNPDIPHREFSAVDSLEVVKRGLSQVERRMRRNPLT